jgi:protein-S-isoprenylcysteine O-methyltransferase Ste14
MIIYFADVFIILLLFTFFGILHSFLASKKIKSLIREKAGNFIAFYRLAYVIISLASFYLIYEVAPRPDVIIYDLKYPFDFIILIPQLLALAGIFWSLKFFCVKEFLGLSQVSRWYYKNYDTEELDEHMTLIAEGPYKFVRHPLYLFSIIFIAARPAMNLFDLIFVIVITSYFYIGSFYEEEKLVDKFGERYLEYQKSVPRLIPFI